MEFATEKMVTAGNKILDFVCQKPGALNAADLDTILADFDPDRGTEESIDFAHRLEDAGILPALLVAEQSHLDLDRDGVIDADELNEVLLSDPPTVTRIAADFAKRHLADIQAAPGGLFIESDFFVPEYAAAYASNNPLKSCTSFDPPQDELHVPRDDLEDLKRYEMFLR